VGEEAEEAVGEQEHKHREQRGDRGVHREVGAFGGTVEITRLLGACPARLLAQEVEVGALFGRQQLGEAGKAWFTGLTSDPDERSSLREALLASGERECALEFGREWPLAVVCGEFECSSERLSCS
jgi:hypothetical protein